MTCDGNGETDHRLGTATSILSNALGLADVALAWPVYDAVHPPIQTYRSARGELSPLGLAGL